LWTAHGRPSRFGGFRRAPAFSANRRNSGCTPRRLRPIHWRLSICGKDHRPCYAPGRHLTIVWFPDLWMISIVAGDADGETVETATVGRKGMTGSVSDPRKRDDDQRRHGPGPGLGSRMEAATFHAAVEASPSLRRVMLRYVLAVITQISQNAACNQLHAINMRCARWLVTAHDRVGGDSFGPTQSIWR
jgi:hypothetical protein